MPAKRSQRFVLYAASLLLLLVFSAGAQEVRFTSSTLDEITQSKLQQSLQRLVEQYGSSGMPTRVAPSFELTRRADLPQNGGTRPSLRMDSDRVQIVVETLERSDIDGILRWIESHSGSVQLESRGSIQAVVPVAHLTALSNLNDVSFVRLPVRIAQKQAVRAAALAQGTRISEGVEVIGSALWNEAGLDGAGVKVGLLDQFGRYRELMGRELPTEENVTIRSFASHGEIFDPEESEQFQSHGTSVAEIIYDIAPGASHYLAYFETLVEMTEASDWLIEQGVDVVNSSLGFDSGCFRDGDGLFEPIFADAKNAGISWASAAGNEGDIHYLSAFTDPDDDLRHNFDGSDEGNTVETILTELELSDGSVVATAEFFVIYSWDADCVGASDDYEMVLMREVNGFLEVVPEQNMFNDWLFEPGRPIKFFFGFFDYDVSREGERETFHLGFRKINPLAENGTRIMALHYGCFCFSIEYLNLEGSVGILEPGVSPNVIGVGAAHHSATDCPSNPGQGFFCPDGRLLFYSSHGPTKDGRQKPELAAPTHVSTISSGRHTGDGMNANPGFTGTSAATPHVAGALALTIQALRAQGMDADPDSALMFLQSRAEDLGDPGIDNAYGAGLLTLGQPPINLQPSEPSFTSIEPASGLQGSTVEAQISGEDLENITEVLISGEGVIASINEASAESISITLEIAPDAPLGPRSIQLVSEEASAENEAVIFTVLLGPNAEVAPEQLAIAGIASGDFPEPQSLTISNIGGGGFTWTVSADVDWISFDTANGTLDEATTAQTTTVSVNTEALDAGDHLAMITFVLDGALNGPITIPVTLTLEQPAEPEVTGELVALKFLQIEFVNATDWERVVVDGCVEYTNIVEGTSPINVILPDGSANTYDIPSGNQVIVCGDVAHIDTRAVAEPESEPEPESE